MIHNFNGLWAPLILAENFYCLSNWIWIGSQRAWPSTWLGGKGELESPQSASLRVVCNSRTFINLTRLNVCRTESWRHHPSFRGLIIITWTAPSKYFSGHVAMTLSYHNPPILPTLYASTIDLQVIIRWENSSPGLHYHNSFTKPLNSRYIRPLHTPYWCTAVLYGPKNSFKKKKINRFYYLLSWSGEVYIGLLLWNKPEALGCGVHVYVLVHVASSP